MSSLAWSPPNNSSANIAERSINAILDPYHSNSSSKTPRLSETEIRQISAALRSTGKESWSRVPRIYAVLHIIGSIQVVDSFVNEGISDLWFPFSHKTLPECLRSPSARFEFLEHQDLVLTKAFDLEREDGKHRHFSSADDIPLQKVEELGKGHFGFVDRVVSTLTYKEYARKRIPRGRTFKKNVEVLRSFEQELVHLKKLSHIHIVELIGSYTDPRFVGILMTPVADCNLQDFLCNQNLSREDKSFLRTFYGCLAAALCYLHENRVKHKDIKPQNVLVKGHHVFLTDFGIAVDWSDLGQSTTTGVTVRTPRYCAPEVAEYMPRNSASDVWSLGCVFLEIWTVLKGETISQLFAYLSEQGSKSSCYYLNPLSVTEWCGTLKQQNADLTENAALTWIEGSMQADQKERWTARMLVDSIAKVNDDEDHRYAFSGVCCMDLDDFSESTLSSKRASRILDETSASNIEAYQPNPVSFQHKSPSSANNTDEYVSVTIRPSPSASQSTTSSNAEQPPNHEEVRNAFVSVSDSHSEQDTVPSDQKEHFLLEEVKDIEAAQKLEGHNTVVLAVALSSDKSLQALGSYDWTVRLCDVKTHQEVQKLVGHIGGVWAVAFSPDGSLLASGSVDRTVRLWEAKTGQQVQKLQGHNGGVWAVGFSPDGSLLASGSSDRTVRLWDVKTGELIQKLVKHIGGVETVAFSPDGSLLASGSCDRTVRLWEVKTGQEVKKLVGHGEGVIAMAFSPNGSLLASGSSDQSVRLWDVKKGQEVRNLKGHLDRVMAVAFSSDGSLLASGSYDRTMRLWEVGTGQEVQKLVGHGDRVLAVAFCPDGSLLASGSYDRTVRLHVTSLPSAHEASNQETPVLRNLASWWKKFSGKT